MPVQEESDSLALARLWLGRSVNVCIDRSLGSRHPRWGFVYEVNYGYLPGVIAPDGEGLDAYVLGVEEPLQEFAGCCIAIVHRLDDDDDKLVVVPEGTTLTDDEIRAQTWFQEQFFESRIVRA
jgi:inorganic pyrophosphatase